MSDSFQFSEAARLYVKYLAVVNEMRQLFESNVSAFLDAVRTRMQAKLDNGKIEESINGGYLSWWIEDEDTKNEDEVPYIWLERKNADIIGLGVLTVIADIGEATEVEKQQLSARKSSLNLPMQCKVFDRRLFGVTITYGDGDPVEAAAEPILSILVALHQVEKNIFATRAKKDGRNTSKTNT